VPPPRKHIAATGVVRFSKIISVVDGGKIVSEILQEAR